MGTLPLLILLALVPPEPPTPEVAEIRAAAAALVAAVEGPRRERLVAAYDDAGRRAWSYLRGERPGLMLADLRGAAGASGAAARLVDATLSAAGRERWTLVRALEDANRARSLAAGRDGDAYGGDLYAIRLFGDPAAARFAWRLEGHHVTLAATLDGDRIAVTPLFWGAHPATVPDGPRRGERPLGPMQDAAFALRRSLTPEQAARADFGGAVPADILTAPGGEHRLDAPSGLPFAALDEAQRRALLELLALHLGDLAAPLARGVQDRLESRGAAELHFGFAGEPDPAKLHYYRIWHPDLVVEFDASSGDPTHLHCVVHDRSRGPHGDPLREHLAGEHATPKP